MRLFTYTQLDHINKKMLSRVKEVKKIIKSKKPIDKARIETLIKEQKQDMDISKAYIKYIDDVYKFKNLNK